MTADQLEKPKQEEEKKEESKGKRRDVTKGIKGDSKLSDEVFDLVQLLFNPQHLTKAIEKVGYDTEQMPLGQLTTDQVFKGFEILEPAEQLVKGLKKARENEDKPMEEKILLYLDKISNKFYANIPHRVVGRVDPIKMRIDSEKKLEEKVNLLDSIATYHTLHKTEDGKIIDTS